MHINFCLCLWIQFEHMHIAKSGSRKQVHDCQLPRWNQFMLLFFENFESFSKSSCCAEAGGQSEKVKLEAPGQRARDSDLSQHLWWKFAVTLYYILLSCGESATQPDQCNNPASPCQKVCRPYPDGAEMVTERERKSCNRPVFLSFQALSWAAQCVTSAPPPFVLLLFVHLFLKVLSSCRIFSHFCSVNSLEGKKESVLDARLWEREGHGYK